MKRYLDCSAPELAQASKADLLHAIRASESRILAGKCPGDTGYAGLTLPKTIFICSLAIRGVRHAYRRVARPVLR